jgi:hypothetical protein
MPPDPPRTWRQRLVPWLKWVVLVSVITACVIGLVAVANVAFS